MEYYWSAEQWQECQPDVLTNAGNDTCGFGSQERRVRYEIKTSIYTDGSKKKELFKYFNYGICLDLDSREEQSGME